jgi:hypothetical protein
MTTLSPPKRVCLCGSTRFKTEFEIAMRNETLDGNIVLTVGFFGHSDPEAMRMFDEFPDIKPRLDELHLRKIDLADEVLVINVGGYIGDSTRREIEYAKANGKPVSYFVPLALSAKKDESSQ